MSAISANWLSVVLDLYYGSEAPIGSGFASLIPSQQLTDAPDQQVVVQGPVIGQFGAAGLPVVNLLACDSMGPEPSGWSWQISFPGVPGNPQPYNIQPFAGPVSFSATDAAPAVFVFTPVTGGLESLPNGTGVQLSGGSLPAGFTAGTTYFIVNSSAYTFELAATSGGSPIASTSTGSGQLTVVQCNLSALTPVVPQEVYQGYMLPPSGTPSAGMVPVASGSGGGSAWGTVATNPMTTAGDTIYGGLSGAPTRLPGNTSTTPEVLASTGTGGAAQDPQWQTMAELGVLTNPLTASGDTLYGGASGALQRLAGDTSNTRKFLREQSSAGVAQPPAWDTIEAGDVPTLNQSTTGNAATATAAAGLESATTTVVVSAATAPTSGQVLTATSSTAADWQNPSGGAGTATGLATATTTVAVSAATAPAAGQVLTAINSTSASWQNASSGFSNPMTALGDFLYGGTSGVAARLAGSTSSRRKVLTQTGTGSVSAAPALREPATSWINVVDMGADPTGVADSTTAIQNTINAAATLGVGLVYHPSGTYLVTPPSATVPALTIPSNIVLGGDGIGASTLLKGGNGIVLDFSGTGPFSQTTAFSVHQGLRDLAVNGNGFTGLLIRLYYVQFYYEQNVYLYDNADVSVDTAQFWDSRITNGLYLYGGSTSASAISGAQACTHLLRNSAAPATTLSAGISGTITALPVAALPAAMPAGVVQVWNGSGQLQNFTTTGASSGATSIPVASAAVAHTFTSGNAVNGFGWSGDNVNSLTMMGCHWEDGLSGAIWVTQGIDNASAPNNIYILATKIESDYIGYAAPIIQVDGSVGGMHIDHLQLYAGSFNSGFSTPVVAIQFRPNYGKLSNVDLSNGGYATVSTGIDANGGTSAVLDNIFEYWATSPTVAGFNGSGGNNILDKFVIAGTCTTPFSGTYTVVGGTATGLASATTTVGVSSATAPTAGQVLTATSGSAATWQNPASGFSNPMTTLGDIIYENSTPAAARLAGSTSATKKFLTQTGTGSVSAAPGWNTIAAVDLPAATTSAQGAVQLDGTSTDIQALGAQAAGSTGKAADAGHVHPTTGLLLSGGNAATATAAAGLESATTTVVVSAATAPTSGQVLTATSSTAADWQTPSSGFADPMTTVGDIMYEGTGPAPARLAGNTSATKEFLSQTGTGSVSAAPSWGALASGDIPNNAANTSGSAGSFTGSLAGDVTGTQGATTVGKIQGVAVTSAEATLVSDLNNATSRSATATLLAGEETIFTGSTSGQTLTLPASPPSSSVNTITNTASVSVTLAPGSGATLSNFGTSGNITIPAGYTFQVVYIGTTWYVQSAGPSDFAKSSALSIANGGTGQTTAAASYNALSPMTTLGDLEYESGASTASRLAGNTTATKKFLTQTGTGSVSAAPGWSTLVSGDIPNNAANTTGSSASCTGNAATATNLAGGATLSDYLAPAASALTYGTTIAVNAALGNAFNLTLTASTATISNPTNPVEGQVIRFRITQGTGGSFTVAWGTAYDFGAGSAPTLSTAASKVDIIAFEYVSSISKWCCLGAGLGY